MTASLTGFKENERLRDLRRAQTDLYWLCSEVLEYAWNKKLGIGMVRHFHGPMCERMDRLQDHPRVATFTERGALKTTIFTIGLILQEILRNPEISIFVVHAVEDEVMKIISECRNHIQSNDSYRRLLGDACPAKNAKSWFKTDEFTVRRKNYNRQPTLRGASVNSEITGAHVDLFMLDDIVSRRTIENSELSKVKSWLRNTMTPVLNPGGRIRCVGTRWDLEDPYQDMIDSRDWDVLVRSAQETDGSLDYKGEPVYYGPNPGDKDRKAKRLRLLKREMGPDYASQMMNDPSPAGEKPWDPSMCEHYISLNEARGEGVVVVFSDPAPAKTGSLNDAMQKQRGDGSKDDWAIAVVKFRRNEQRDEMILLDGDYSKSWTMDEGFTRICAFQRKWSTPYFANESVGQAIALFNDKHREVARVEGVKHRPIRLKMTYKGKNVQFATLASRAANDEFLICKDTVPEKFLKKFLEQARNWRPIGTSKNSLRFDDCANCVSFACDPAVKEEVFIPKVQRKEIAFSPFHAPVEEHDEYGTRYISY